MRESLELGKAAEERAALYLLNNGYKILETNYRCRTGEIDIIAEYRDYIVFAEVKYRRRDDFGSALEMIDNRKIRKIISASRFYLGSHRTNKQPRFDTIEVMPPDSVTGDMAVEHIEDAFDNGTLYHR